MRPKDEDRWPLPPLQSEWTQSPFPFAVARQPMIGPAHLLSYCFCHACKMHTRSDMWEEGDPCPGCGTV